MSEVTAPAAVEVAPEVAPEVEAAPPVVEAKVEAPKSNKQKYQLKVDGQNEELELDLDNKEEIQKHLQLSRAAQKRMQETADYKKQVAQFFDVLKSDPRRILSDPKLGIDIKALANSIINEEIEDLQKSPETRERDKALKELETIKKQIEDDKKSREEQEFARLQEQASVQLDRDITAALASEGMPKNARAIKYTAEALMLALQNDIDLSAADVMPMIKKQMLQEYQELIGSLPEDALEDFIGKDVIGKVRKRSIKNMKAPVETAQSVKPTGGAAKVAKPEEKVPFKKIFSSF